MVTTASPPPPSLSHATRQDCLRDGASGACNNTAGNGAARSGNDATAGDGATVSSNNACHFDLVGEKRVSWVRIELERE